MMGDWTPTPVAVDATLTTGDSVFVDEDAIEVIHAYTYRQADRPKTEQRRNGKWLAIGDH
jgi:hypothetical protein